ncbi:MAG: T9SS type A sorting domain-containing protein, partial [Flavobacteriales bacterium]
FDEYENEYYVDFETGTYLPTDFDWTFESPDPNTIYSPIVSSFQRLENGNSLICSGSKGDTREYTQEGELVWHYKTPFLNQAGTGSPQSQGTILNPMQNLTFRASRYPADYPAFDDIDFVTGLPIELNPIMLASCLSGCDLTLSLDSISFDTLGFATVTVGAEGSSQINIIEWMSLADSTIYPYAQELTFTTSEAGDFMITVTDLMGCTYSLVVSVIFDGLEGVDNPTALKFGLYPNPSNGFMNISFSKTIHQADIKVIDMQGRIVFSLNNTSSLNESLDLNHLNSGTYFVSVSSDEGFAMTKILIQK